MFRKIRYFNLLIMVMLPLGVFAAPPTEVPLDPTATSPLEIISAAEPTVEPATTLTRALQSGEDACLLFGDGQYAEAQKHIIPLSSAFTVELWVYDTEGSGQFVEYISHGSQPGPFYLGTTEGSDILRAGDAWVDTGYVMPKKKWVHIAITRSGSGTGTLYVNGESVGTKRNYDFGSGGSPTRLGSQFGTPSEFFTGCMDEVKVFKSARGESEIKSDMQKLVSAASDPNLVAYYDFNDQSDPNAILQASGSSQHALQLALPGQWSRADNVTTRLAISSEIGLSNCPDGNCGAYIDTDGLNIRSSFQSGFGWYSTVWPLLTEVPDPYFQMGLGSTWLTPDLRKFEKQRAFLDAIKNVCGSFGEERGAGQWILFQSIEGGLGYWADTRFKSAMPKWRFNATSNCYHSMEGTPGWPTGRTEPLDMNQTGLVQLSNRMLLAPDGQTFPLETQSGLLGVAWIALPFPQVGVQKETSRTGSNAWTLFMNSENFKGPLAYWMPQYFSGESQKDPTLAGYGLDANPGLISSMASEMGWISMVEGADARETVYARIPQLRFPVNVQGQSLLSQDVVSYSDQAATAPFNHWLTSQTDAFGPFSAQGSLAVPMSISHQPSYYQHDDPIVGLAEQVRISAFDGGTSYGLLWTDPTTTGEFPSYFKDQGSTRSIVKASAVPAETHLAEYKYQYPASTVSYNAAGWWDVENTSVPGGTVTLSDGSHVEYVWFKFVDQPALRRLNLSEADRAALQAMVENMHRTWPITAEYMAPPSSGDLVSFDPALLVTPPLGMEYGYVPIAISQTGNVVGPSLPSNQP